MPRNNKFLGHLVAFLTVAVWGSTFVFTKLLLLSGLSAAQIFTLRFIIAYVLLMLFSLTRKNHRWLADTWKDELLMVGLGLTGGSMYFLTENEAMNYTTTTNTSLIVCLCPLFATALIGAVYKSERLRPSQMLGTVLAAIGVVVVVLNGHFVLHLSPLGDSLAFAACLCWAFYSLLMISANRRYDVVFITRKVFFYGLLSMIPYYLLSPEGILSAYFLRPSVQRRVGDGPFHRSQLALPRLHRIDGVLRRVELGVEDHRCRHGHQLRLYQSRHHDCLCVADTQRAHHRILPHRYRLDPHRHVSRR